VAQAHNKITDLEQHLNMTQSIHKDHGYDDWSKEVERQIAVDGKINMSELARFMNVNFKTIHNTYLPLYESRKK
jgi:hypothetical protein